jgi:anti-sigma B factor antagonist
MKTSTSTTQGIRVLACEGTMMLGGGADELDDVFQRALREAGGRIVLDLTRLRYLDSAGVGAVVSCSKHAAFTGSVMKVALRRSGPVRKVFEITQLERGFEIFDDAESAAASFK